MCDDVPEDLLGIKLECTEEGFMRMVDGHCAALDPDGKCSIYDDRPWSCSSFTPGEDPCNEKRKERNLPPYPVENPDQQELPLHDGETASHHRLKTAEDFNRECLPDPAP